MPQPPRDDPSTADVPPGVARARDVPTLLDALSEADPGRPRVTWYGAGGERVELSARVLANWVAKSADLLVHECDVEPGDVVQLALPPSWRTLVLALATWSAGAEPSWDGDEGEMLDDLEPQPPAVLVTTADGPVGPAGRVVAVDLPALSRAVEGAPSGALDYNAEVTGRDDVFDADEQVQDRRVLELADDLAGISGYRPGERVLGLADDLPPDLVLGALHRDGSVVMVAVDAGADLDDLARQEQATARA
ncbi:TIGR03089 family protein [Pseudokineococcus basanitobsidens]|uniref:TIGR03089 family protein n=1 Tax=Pseudokineococcus basanitobsidens TaxID=1926649 RepID=A0ABU8RNG6_9ACTN